MITPPALVRQQTAAVVAFLRAACPVCSMAPCDPETHEATLRVRASLVRRPDPAPIKGSHVNAFAGTDIIYSCSVCHKDFVSTCAAGAKYCPACRPTVNAEKARRSSKSQAARKKVERHKAKNRGNGIATRAAALRRSA